MKMERTPQAVSVEETARHFRVSRRFVYYAMQFRNNSALSREIRLYMADRGWLFG